jgi:hypothetical protein
MSDIPGRVYRVAKAYLDAARDRLGEIDSLAQEELSRSLSRDDIRIPDPPPASSNDPLERARAKIAAAQQTMTDPVQTAYKIIGVAPGSDYVTVQQAVTKLRERCAPTRFPDGSQEQAETRVILQRVEEAFQVLSNTLNPGAGRFDKLEF